ncbi:MAG: GWxTD domain-containing protein [Ignavibacteriales bacterium]|nr:GWxTD domain-containing protein [Ignavibacteriales bacterium]
MDSAYFAYERAINMMDQNEKEFKYLSASFLTENKIIESAVHNYKPEEDKAVDNFWKISDPLFLTKYNERLLEHYSRVSYSNLKFSVDELELKVEYR